MEITDEQMARAETAMEENRAAGHATAARYDAAAKRLIVSISNGQELVIPTCLIQDLADADPADLIEIEITPAGLGLHWPRIDAGVYVPSLISGVFGTRNGWQHNSEPKVEGHPPPSVSPPPSEEAGLRQ